ncbi:putative ribonuclease HI large subunit [Cryptosporidium serpentis]
MVYQERIYKENICLFNKRPVILGIDEAGRGPVLGPMVFACFYYPTENEKLLKLMNINDSKKLTENSREKINKDIRNNKDKFGWGIDILLPQYLSCQMLKKQKYNLNEISHTAAINLIKSVLQHGVNLTHIYVDTVGPPESYKKKLKLLFPSMNITVTPKADSLYPCVSGASILAKVERDYFLSNWWSFPGHDRYDHNGNNLSIYEQGSGYPGDPKTKQFLKQIFHKVFGFPNIVRFSWSTADQIIEKEGVSVRWTLDEDNSEQSKISFSTSREKEVIDLTRKKRKIDYIESNSKLLQMHNMRLASLIF